MVTHPRCTSKPPCGAVALPNNRCLSHLFSRRKGNSVNVGNAHQTPSLTVATVCMIMFSDFSHRLTMSHSGLNLWISHVLLEKNPLGKENKHPICIKDTVSKWGCSEEQVFFLYEWTITPRRDDISLLWRFFQYSRWLFAVIGGECGGAFTNKSNRSGINHAARMTDWLYVHVEFEP